MATQTMTRLGVEVQQEFATQSATNEAPLLPSVIVGVNAQVAKDEKATGNYTGDSVAFAYPNLELGAVMNLASVTVKLKSVVTKILDSVAVTATLANDTATVVGLDFVTSGVAAGDDFVATDGTLTYTAKVVSVTSATVLKLDRNLVLTTPTFVVKRSVADQTIASGSVTADADEVTLAAAIAVSTKPIIDAEVFVSYTAVRQLTANTLTIIGEGEGEAKLGKASLDNPLALGAQLAKANTITSVLVCGVSEDTPAGWLEALDFLTSQKVYGIALLTFNPSVNTFLKTHVEQMSAPTKSKFRIGFANFPHPREKTVVTELLQASLVRATNVLTVMHPMAEFGNVVTGVKVGDYVTLTARTTAPVTTEAEHAGTYRVSAVVNNGVLTFDGFKYTGENGNYTKAGTAAFSEDFTADAVDLTVFRLLDKQGQAEAIAATADALHSRRLVMVTNAECVIDIDGVDTVAPGYYLSAALAGMCAGNQPHQGFSGLSIAGVKSVRYGKDYFNEDQLGLIGGSGGFIFEQEAENAPPVVYYQTTTDTTSTQTKELSVTKTFDYYSIGLKERMDRYIGPFNIYNATLTLLSNTIDGWHKFLLGKEFPQIGTPILDGKLTSLIQNELEPTVVDIVTDIVVPLPLNKIRARVRLNQ